MTRRLALPALVVAGLALGSCLDHYVAHPRTPPPGAVASREEVWEGDLRTRVEVVRPAGDGPFPAVLVHPEAGHPAAEMRGVLHALAADGYLAVAVDYRRRGRGGSLFPWRRPEDAGRALERMRAMPGVDPARVALLGFSQGGVYSLLIAAYAGEVGLEPPAAVVAYYPLSDFGRWLDDPSRRGMRRLVFKLIRFHFRKVSGARDEGDFQEILARASPLRQAERLRSPVLLVHGDRDTSAPLAESERLAARLRELGKPVELVVVPGEGHVFNFKHRESALDAWARTRAFLAEHLR